MLSKGVTTFLSNQWEYQGWNIPTVSLISCHRNWFATIIFYMYEKSFLARKRKTNLFLSSCEIKQRFWNTNNYTFSENWWIFCKYSGKSKPVAKYASLSFSKYFLPNPLRPNFVINKKDKRIYIYIYIFQMSSLLF